MKNIEKLTKAEEDVMQYFWEHGPNTVSMIIDMMDDPKPPHSTISSIARILETKGFLDHNTFGKTYQYFPIIDKKEYSGHTIKNLVSSYFEGSFNNLVSFLVDEKKISLSDLEKIKNQSKK
jgi:BlaI family transcriptional regulator, penicillinase repressor